jgi:hypothetical protein
MSLASPDMIGVSALKRSSFWWPVFLCLAVATAAATTASALLEAHLHDFDLREDAWFWFGVGGTTLLTLVSWALNIGERDRRAKATARRIAREAEKIRKLQAEVERAHTEAAQAEMERKKRDANLLNRTVAEMIEKARMEEPTYFLPPPVTFTRTPLDARRAVPNRDTRREQFVRSWLDDTGEIPWPRS